MTADTVKPNIDKDEPITMARPSFYFGEEPDSATVRADMQVYCQAFGAQGAMLILDYGTTGTVQYSTVHPDIADAIESSALDEDDDTTD